MNFFLKSWRETILVTVTWDAGTGAEGSGQWEPWRAASESLWIGVDI